MRRIVRTDIAEQLSRFPCESERPLLAPIMFKALSFLLLFASLGCGARTDLEENIDGSTTDVTLSDRSVDADQRPESIQDAWWFTTVRAVCDSIAIEFCSVDTVAVRFSYDDGCRGDRPTSPEPLVAPVQWLSDTEFVVDIVPPIRLGDDEVRGPLHYQYAPASDTLEWVGPPQVPSGQWRAGRRESSLEVPADLTEQVQDFVYCP